MDEEVKPRVEHPANTRKILAERFPNAIMAKQSGRPRAKKPLIRGVYRALAEACPDIDPKAISRFLGSYTKKNSYLRALAADGAMRVDLQGNEVDPVSKEHAIDAGFRLRAKIERIAAKKEKK